jgi:hypothetical protein
MFDESRLSGFDLALLAASVVTGAFVFLFGFSSSFMNWAFGVVAFVGFFRVAIYPVHFKRHGGIRD